MKIRPFAVEEWMNAYETGARCNIAETCVDSISIDELFRLCGEDSTAFWKQFSARRLTYGDIEGAPAFREGICRLYKTLKRRKKRSQRLILKSVSMRKSPRKSLKNWTARFT